MSFSQDLLVHSLDAHHSQEPGAETPAAAGSKTARLGEDILRLLYPQGNPPTIGELQSVAFHEVTGVLPRDLEEVSTSLEAGPEKILLAVFAMLLARLSGQEVVSLRRYTGRPVVLNIPFEMDTQFRSVLAAVATTSHASDQPCAVEFSFGENATPVILPSGTLRLTARLADGRVELFLASSTGLWPRSLLQQWLKYFDHLLGAAIANPDTPWRALVLLDPVEALEFYRDLNSTSDSSPEPACVQNLVTHQAMRTPDAIAVASPACELTYRELEQRSDAIADRLRSLGAGPDRPIAVYLERSVALPVVLLAVLKSGSCYVPLDTQDAPARVAAILAECRPLAIITDDSVPLPPEFGSIPVLTPADAADGLSAPGPLSAVTPDHLAYVIFTSGSTGKPKGVPIRHSALVNFIRSASRSPGISSADRMMAVAPISFDISAMDMFLPLVSGGTLVVADRHAASDPVRLAAMLEQFEITVLQATPVTWRLLVSSDWEGKRDLKMLSGGEALPRDLANQLLALGSELWNLYGPTETTIYSSILRVETGLGIVPLGPPIANTTLYVCDDNGVILPPGVPGELYIGGAGVSPGYLEIQQGVQRFVPDPFAKSPGAHMFRTGDLVRLLDGNRLEFFGRLDHQVKLRGYRIELGEIEFAIRNFDPVDNAVAALIDDGLAEPYLIAYLTASQPDLDLKNVRRHISRLLPAYMVPTRFVLVEALPLTNSGKIDRKALAAVASSALSAYHQAEGVPPANDCEQKLLAIFQEVLSAPDFGVTDSFFDFGGYSLLTVKLFTRIYRSMKVRLPVTLLFDAPTVRALAAVMERSASLPALVEIRSRGASAPLFVIHSYLLYDVFRQVVEPSRPIFGLRESVEVAPESVEDSAAVYVKEMLKVCPNGPFLLTGWCAAGSLTLEIARQLRRQNHQVGLVALLDAERPGYRPPIRGKRLALLAAKLKFHWRRLNGTSISQKLEYIRDFLRHGIDTALERLFVHRRPWVLRLQRLLGSFVPRPVFDNAWSRIGALQSFCGANYPGKVVLFRAADVPVLRGGDETLGWGEIVDGGVDVVFIPGDHESMFLKPNVQFLAHSFRQAITLSES